MTLVSFSLNSRVYKRIIILIMGCLYSIQWLPCALTMMLVTFCFIKLLFYAGCFVFILCPAASITYATFTNKTGQLTSLSGWKFVSAAIENNLLISTIIGNIIELCFTGYALFNVIHWNIIDNSAIIILEIQPPV